VLLPRETSRAFALTLFASFIAMGCSRKGPSDPAPATTGSSATIDLALDAGASNVVLDAIEHLDECTLGHRGVLLDLGDPSMRGRYGPKLDTPDPESVEHEGATWARISSRTVSASFFWSDELARADADAGAATASADGGATDAPAAYVEARIKSVSAKSATFFLNGKPIETTSLAKGETRVVRARGGSGAVFPGPNEVTVRLNGGSRSEDDVFAEIDWIHVGVGDPGEPYAAPTRTDALVHAAVGGTSKRALSMRGPGFVRCATWIPHGATVQAALALEGHGEAEVEVRLLRDRSMPIVLGSTHVSGTTQRWTSLSTPVGDVGDEGAPAAIELAVVRATRGSRVLFGDPRIVAAPRAHDDAAPRPKTISRGVVLVVMGGIAQKSLGPYGGARSVPELSLLASEGVVFDSHRASSSLANGSLASMLTGLGARAHTIEDESARLPHALATIADGVKLAGVSTAMFTANPTTGPAFGFDRGFDTYVAHAPTDDTPAVQVFDEAARWIEAHRDERFVIVVHARGGHPPWDVTPDDLKTMAPPYYNGNFDPKHAAEVLQTLKKTPTKLSEADKARVWALYAHAVEAHDTAFGGLLAALRGAGRDGDTTVIVTGDVSANELAPVPFIDDASLDESELAIPLMIRPPLASGLGGKRATIQTSSVDIAKTIVAALGLDAPASFLGQDAIAASLRGADTPAPQVATAAGHFSLRWGTFVMTGSRATEQKMCDLALEPSCTTDVRKQYPIAVDVLHRFAFDALGPTSDAKVSREPAFLDPTTMAGLLSWGRPPEKDGGRRRRD
jgi:arylsulfatase A-like enzyme